MITHLRRNVRLDKILIVYTNAGAGHRRAAEALTEVMHDNFPGKTIKLLDVLEYTNPIFARNYPKAYLFMVNYCPWVWGLFYYSLNVRFIARLARGVRRFTNSHQCIDFEKFVLSEQPELVVTTHFLPNEIISHLKKRHGLKTCLVTCITDYYPHAFWRDSGIDYYFTPNDELTPRLLKLGIPLVRIKDLGIPIMQDFGMVLSQQEMRRKLKLRNEFTLLVTSGGFGVGPIEELVSDITRIKTSIQVVVICGNNPKLQAELEELVKGSNHHFKIFGFVDNMHELMAASDLLISKSGGLTTTEAMAMQLPMIILHPIPGQESGNCQFILEHQAGVKALYIRQVRRILEDLLAHQERLKSMRVNIGKLGRPHAAREIVTFIKDHCWGKERSA